MDWEAWIADWSPACQAHFRELVAHPQFDAARGTARFYWRFWGARAIEVRLGWATKRDRTCLAVLRCDEDRLLLRLAVPVDTAVGEGGGLLTPTPGHRNATPDRADLYVTSSTIPQAVDWLRRAREFTRP